MLIRVSRKTTCFTFHFLGGGGLSNIFYYVIQWIISAFRDSSSKFGSLVNFFTMNHLCFFVKAQIFIHNIPYFDLITAPDLMTAPPDFLIYFHLLAIFSRLFLLNFTYYRSLDDLLALVVENKFT